MAVKARAALKAQAQGTDFQDQVNDLVDSVAAGTQQAHIANASTAHALNSTFSDTEVEGALNTLGTKMNSILTALREFGILASS